MHPCIADLPAAFHASERSGLLAQLGQKGSSHSRTSRMGFSSHVGVGPCFLVGAQPAAAAAAALKKSHSDHSHLFLVDSHTPISHSHLPAYLPKELFHFVRIVDTSCSACEGGAGDRAAFEVRAGLSSVGGRDWGSGAVGSKAPLCSARSENAIYEFHVYPASALLECCVCQHLRFCFWECIQ